MKRWVVVFALLIWGLPTSWVLADSIYPHDHEWMNEDVHQMHDHSGDFPPLGDPVQQTSWDSNMEIDFALPMPESPFLDQLEGIVQKAMEKVNLTANMDTWIQGGQAPFDLSILDRITEKKEPPYQEKTQEKGSFSIFGLDFPPFPTWDNLFPW